MVKPTKYFGCTWGWPNLTVYGLGGTEGGIEPLLVDHFSLLRHNNGENATIFDYKTTNNLLSC
jgi:hypothetical protein